MAMLILPTRSLAMDFSQANEDYFRRQEPFTKLNPDISKQRVRKGPVTVIVTRLAFIIVITARDV